MTLKRSASCIAQLEAETPSKTAWRYPAEAAELEPLLRVVAAMRNTPAPAMPEESFARGRSAIAAAVQARREAAASADYAPAVHAYLPDAPLQTAAPTRRASGRLFAWPTLAGALIAACLLLAIVVAGSQTPGVLPGEGALGALYEVKLLGEEAQGLLMAAAGNEAEWHARLAQRRLAELERLHAQGQPTKPELAERLLAEVQAALALSADLPDAARAALLDDLRRELAAAGDMPGQDAGSLAALQQAQDALAAALPETAAVAAVLPTPAPLPPTAAPVTPAPMPTDTVVSPPTPAQPETVVVLPTPTPLPRPRSAARAPAVQAAEPALPRRGRSAQIEAEPVEAAPDETPQEEAPQDGAGHRAMPEEETIAVAEAERKRLRPRSGTRRQMTRRRQDSARASSAHAGAACSAGPAAANFDDPQAADDATTHAPTGPVTQTVDITVTLPITAGEETPEPATTITETETVTETATAEAPTLELLLPTVTPTATATPEAAGSVTPTLEGEPEEPVQTALPTPTSRPRWTRVPALPRTATPAPETTAAPGITPSATPEPAPVEEQTGPQPSPTYTDAPAATWTVTATPIPTATATATPTAIVVLLPTSTPAASTRYRLHTPSMDFPAQPHPDRRTGHGKMKRRRSAGIAGLRRRPMRSVMPVCPDTCRGDRRRKLPAVPSKST